MSKVQLAVGQVWKDRGGKEVRVAGLAKEFVADTVYPFKGDNEESYTNFGTVYESWPSEGDLIELVQDENGWRTWKATADSQRPVDRDTLVHLRFSNGNATSLKHPSPAGDFAWRDIGPDSIVAYKIVEETPKAEETPAPQPDADGWIPYAGGGCPVDGGVTVEVRLRSGQESAEAADSWDWDIDNVGGDIVAYRVVELTPKAEEPPARRHSHYFKDVSQIDEIDVYRICDLFEVDDSSGATQHAIKKLLCAGKRGAKDRSKDYREAIDTLNRRLAMWEGE